MEDFRRWFSLEDSPICKETFPSTVTPDDRNASCELDPIKNAVSSQVNKHRMLIGACVLVLIPWHVP